MAGFAVDLWLAAPGAVKPAGQDLGEEEKKLGKRQQATSFQPITPGEKVAVGHRMVWRRVDLSAPASGRRIAEVGERRRGRSVGVRGSPWRAESFHAASSGLLASRAAKASASE